jgi:sRNA-binding carbon storage regulator CsrA
MLITTRRVGETIIIAGLVVTVTAANGKRVRLGIVAR